ncbi:MAG: hypothetical protein ABR582_14725 [Gemmatimonadaceae bacterium]
MKLIDWASRVDLFLGTRPRKALIFTLGLLVVATLAKIFAENWIAANILGPLVELLGGFAGVRLGYAGLAIAAVIVLLLLLMFIDSSPTAKTLREWLDSREKSRMMYTPLTAEERNEFERVRELWDVPDVAEATRCLLSLLGEAREFYFDRGNPFADLLGPQVNAVGTATREVTESLAAEQPTMRRVQEALSAFRLEYGKCAVRLNRIRYADPLFTEDTQKKKTFEKWKQCHPAVASIFQLLNRRTAFKGSEFAPFDNDAEKMESAHEFLFRENAKNARARVIAEKLALATDEELSFLRLFTLETLPMKSEDDSTWLAAAIYQAGEDLVRAKVLDSRSLSAKPHAFRFCLPEDTRRAWPLSEDPAHDCIDISLDAVWSSMSRGGGAGLSYPKQSG